MCTLKFTSRQFFRAVGVLIRPRATEVRICSIDQLLFMARQIEPSVKQVATNAMAAMAGTYMFNLCQKDTAGEFVVVQFIDEISATNFLFASLTNGTNPASKAPRGDIPTK
jgi:hypothetical protein